MNPSHSGRRVVARSQLAQVFAEMFGDHRPARSVVPVPELHHGYLIEIDGMALDVAAT